MAQAAALLYCGDGIFDTRPGNGEKGLNATMKRIRLCWLVLCIACVPVSVLAADNHLQVSVGDWPPFIAQNQKHHGFIAHLISDIFAAEGYIVSFHFLPWNRAYREAAKVQRDATAVWMYKAERENDFYYSDPVLKEQFVFFHRKGDGFHWQHYGDLVGLTIGGGLGYSYGPEFDAAAEAELFKLERVASDEQNFLRLLIGRIDVFPEEINVGYFTLRRDLKPEQVAQITHHPKPVLENESFMLFPRKGPDSLALVKKFNKRLRQFQDSGRYQTYFAAFERGEYEVAGD
ncbi:substrate-binding periplasmic protein [Marinobacter caseinilyticus]|uniref:substrate-binding periplasmic protein n=1 Tax=Marinobacter caseinilyticus TaxID=2692195 RepID=UPI00140AA9AD|nr:transporter substrate-binding domain-containing protein [Marinobacter caseinilyticus]